MKFTWFVRVYPRVNPIVFGKKPPNRTTDMGENVPPNLFLDFNSAGMGFSEENTSKQYSVSDFPLKKLYSFLSSDSPFPGKWSCPQKFFFSVILENIVFFVKIVE